MTAKRLSKEQVMETYETISTYHKDYLAGAGVKLPQLEKGGEFTKDALVLVYLAQGYPDTRWITKKELTDFVRLYHPDTNDVQAGRHLGMQRGFYIVSSRRGNYLPEGVPPPKGDSYLLVTLEKPHPAFVPKRRSPNTDSDFEAVKQRYDYRCATCGSREGEMNLRYKNQRT
jgi:hypothetical protein